MHRRSAMLLLAVLAAMAGLRLSAAATDTEAMRCAIACGHGATPGSACCPMAGVRPAGAALAACPRSDPQSVGPSIPAQPVLVGSVYRLAVPERASIFEGSSAVPPRSPSPRPPDHVPLLLS